MPKQTLKIEGFHGGLNTNADPRDIQDIQSPNLQDVKISKLGRTSTLGGSGTASGTSNSANLLNNKGLFVMDADRSIDNSESNTTLYILYDNNTENYNVFDTEDGTNGTWHANEITNVNSSNPVFFNADGILRITDGTLGNSSKNSWYGYISDRKFQSLNADSLDIDDWIDTDKRILKPSVGNGVCLISTPKIGSDGNTVNSTNAEYDGDIADTGNSGDVVRYDNVNLRVGIQHTILTVSTFAADWNRNSGSPFNAVSSTDVAETIIHPLFGNTVAVTGDTGYYNRISLFDTDSGTTFELQLGEEESIGIGVRVPLSDNNGTNLEYIQVDIGDSTNNPSAIQWKFYRDELSDNLEWNLLVCSRNNVSFMAANADFDATHDNISISAYQATNETSNHSPDWYISGPVIMQNPSLEGFQPGRYSFHNTYLYDDSKQESLPTEFLAKGSTVDKERINIIGAPVLFNFDSYIIPYEIYDCTTTVASHRINDTSHGLTAGTPIKFNGISGTTFSSGTPNTDTFFVSAESLNADNFRLSTSFANAIAGTSITFSNSDDASVTYEVYAFNKRIVGSRLYYKLETNDNYFLIGELDFVNKGFKWFPESDTVEYDMVNSSHPSGVLRSSALLKGISPTSANLLDTFQSINGHSTEATSLEAMYKTAVVHGRRVYVGNIKQDGELHSDRMLKSKINKFDTFPSGMGVVDVAIRDGESIVKLEAFSDRILQFKQKSLYIINVSENVDFLEDVYRNKGCEFDYHVSKTDYGITWFNKFGVYLFDGKNVTNLLEKDSIRLISESDWETFVTATMADMSKCHIAYIPKRRQILVNNADDDIFLYDLVLRAWTKGIDKTTYTTARTNFALDSDQDLFYIQGTQSQLKIWSSSSESTDKFIYETKDIDFGQPSVRKKIYKVYMSYKGNASNVQVHYGVNGLSPSLTFNNISSGTNGSSTGSGSSPNCIAYDAGTTDWLNAELKPSAPVNNINSFRLKISADGTNSISSDFEINDITIVYRLKNIK